MNDINLQDILERLERLEKANPWVKDIPSPSLDNTTICSVCKMEFKGVTGYVCTNSRCPTFTRITF